MNRELAKVYFDMYDEALELTEIIERKLNVKYEKNVTAVLYPLAMKHQGSSL